VEAEAVEDDRNAHLRQIEAPQVAAESEELGAAFGLLDVPVEVVTVHVECREEVRERLSRLNTPHLER
jgi:hypothetical protein